MAQDEGADIYTIGHSTRTLEELIDALKSHGIGALVDIRSVPRSRHVPQFNQDALAETLPAAGIEYRHIKALGGWRKGSRPDSPNTGWRSPGFRAYADYMLTEDFEAALQELLSLARRTPAAYMCAEATPYRCHRSLVSDSLTARGLRVRHIMGPGKTQAHRLTPFARVSEGRVTYPPPQ